MWTMAENIRSKRFAQGIHIFNTDLLEKKSYWNEKKKKKETKKKFMQIYRRSVKKSVG